MATMENRYDGVVGPEVVKHAVKKMRQMGFPRDEWEDLLQELAIEVLAFRFQEGKSNGATRTTALCAMVNNRLISLWRSRQRYLRRLELLEPDESCDAPPMGLAADVRDALAAMTPKERQVCRGLVEDVSISQMARLMRCHRATVRRLINGVRHAFRRLGLNGWVR